MAIDDLPSKRRGGEEPKQSKEVKAKQAEDRGKPWKKSIHEILDEGGGDRVRGRPLSSRGRRRRLRANQSTPPRMAIIKFTRR